MRFGRLTRLTVLLFALALGYRVGAPELAHAGWEYAQWGMSVEEVRAASNREARPVGPREEVVRPEGLVPLLKAPYITRIFETLAYFYFDQKSQKLANVHMTITNPIGCRGLGAALRGLHGEPSNHLKNEAAEITTWRDSFEANQVNLTMINAIPLANIKAHCLLTYSPLEPEQQ